MKTQKNVVSKTGKKLFSNLNEIKLNLIVISQSHYMFTERLVREKQGLKSLPVTAAH